MKALIDADILCYSFGSLTDDEGHPLRKDLIMNHLNSKIKEIKERSGSDEYLLFLSGDNNFRKKEGTIKPYKGTRPSEKPHAFPYVKEFLASGKVHPVQICDGYEADDGLGIAQFSEISKQVLLCRAQRNDWDTRSDYVETLKQNPGTCICSNDKDMLMIPGYHYSWSVSDRIKEKETHWVDEEEADYNFFSQLLTGDSTDNIPGLYGIGPTKAKRRLDGLTGALSLYCKVRQEYENYFGSYWRMFMYENARLLWIWRKENDDVREWLDELEDQRLIQEKEMF